MILVVGATGSLGGEICRQLTEQGRPVRALVRPTSDPAKVETLQRLGAELAPGDLKEGTSLEAACRGVQAVITTASTTLSRQPGDTLESVDRDGQMRLVDAAKAAGMPHFVFVSSSGNTDIPYPLNTTKRTVERYVGESGMAYTILRPTFFMDIWLSPRLGFDYAGGKATTYGTGDGKISYIALGDVAQFAGVALDTPSARNAVIALGGPDALSQREVVRLFEETTGRRFEVQEVPEQALRAQYASATDPLQQTFAALMLFYAQGDIIPMTETLQAFPLKLTSVHDYAERVLSAQGPTVPHKQ